MRHENFIRLPMLAAFVFFLNIEPGLAADPAHGKEKIEKSPAVTSEQLDAALMPIMAEIGEVRAENERLGRLVAIDAPSDTRAGSVESALLTIRIALVVMGLGPLGAAFFLWDAALKRGDPRRIGRARRGKGVVGQQVDDGVQRRVHRLHTFQRGDHGLVGRHRAMTDRGGKVVGGPAPERFGHGVTQELSEA